MRYRKLPMTAPITVTVPQLSGGLNLYDTPDRLADSQLTDCENMWWHNGALRTRPGLVAETKEAPHYNHHQNINEREVFLSRTRIITDGTKMDFYAAIMTATEGWKHLGAGATYRGAIPAEGYEPTVLGFPAEKNADSGWYAMLSSGEIIRDTADGWEQAAPYVPTVMINGAGEEFEGEATPAAYEDYNCLTRAFSCTYTTDGVSKTWKLPMDDLGTSIADGDEKGPTALKVEVTLAGANGLNVRKGTMTMNDQGMVPEISITTTLTEAGNLDGEKYKAPRILVRYSPVSGKVTTEVWATDKTAGTGANTEVKVGVLPAVTGNNLKITAYRNEKYEKQRLEICRMTRATPFGGDRSGTEGGTRYFVTGNPDEPNLVRWSGIEHPLYFPEHNHVRIGDEGQAVTAFGKQGDLLIAFKEREIYALQYVAGTEDDSQFAVSGDAAVTTYSAKFPITPISPAVGCNCPDTVRLVDNRLVWLNDNGQVYMLTATNQYSERNVRMISRNITEHIRQASTDVLRKARAAEYNGYYALLVGKKIYLLDTQTSAFHNFNYYSDEDSARKALPWFVWTLPKLSEGDYAYTAIASDGINLRLSATIADGKTNEPIFRLEGDTDDGQHIACRFATKLWDFGRPDRKKSVEEIYTNVGCLPGGRVRLTYQTENGEYEDPYPIKDHRDDEARARRYLRRTRVTPNMKMVQVFGIKFQCDRAMEVDGLYIKVRQQGVVR